jgi:prepilin-type N-terminal cleavage/methylation domain-containing protein
MKITRPGVQPAFTLVELLVVTATVGILAALLLPAISQSKKRAQQIQCVENLHQLGIGIQNFVTDNHAYPSGFAGTNTDNFGPWFVQLQRGGFDISKLATNFISNGVWLCPADRLRRDWHSRGIPISYGYNVYGSSGIGVPTNALGLMGHFVSFSAMFEPIKESEVITPSDMMAIGDSFAGGVFFMRENLKTLNRNGRASSRHQGKPTWSFATATLNRRRCHFFLPTPAMQLWFAGISTISPIEND